MVDRVLDEWYDGFDSGHPFRRDGLEGDDAFPVDGVDQAFELGAEDLERRHALHVDRLHQHGEFATQRVDRGSKLFTLVLEVKLVGVDGVMLHGEFYNRLPLKIAANGNVIWPSEA